MDKFTCQIFGEPREFTDKLPTYEDVMKFCLLQRQKIMVKNEHSQEPAFKGTYFF